MDTILHHLRRLPADAEPSLESFERAEWPALFNLLSVAADLPRLADNRTLAELPVELWPQLAEVTADLVRLQRIVDHPVVPTGARIAGCHPLSELEDAAGELERDHCVTVDFLLEDRQRERLDRAVEALAETRQGTWGELERSQAGDLFELFDAALASHRFRRLTGFDASRDTYTLTLSLQDLEASGIGWHRDLYWPREWVGEDVFAVLYGLGDDTPEKGGAFLHYVPWRNALYASYRQRHQATILWNSREDSGRLLHAVSEYHTRDTSRHLIILQCLRRLAPPPEA